MKRRELNWPGSDLKSATRSIRRGIFGLALSILALSMLQPRIAGASKTELNDEPVPLQVQAIPERPQPIEAGNSFLGQGPIDPGFTIPGGATWQPQLLIWGTMRSAVQTSERNGRSSDRTSAWVNRLDIFGEIEVSPTERAVIGFRPIHNDGQFSGCMIENGPLDALGFDEDCDWEWDEIPRIAFVEGNFSELWPDLDPRDSKNLDVEFSVGRQLFLFQDGMLVNDFMDGLAIAKNNIPFSVNTRVFGIVTINDVHRSPGRAPVLNEKDPHATLSMIGIETDFPKTTMNLDAVYINSVEADSIHLGLSFVQRLGKFNTTFRGLYSNRLNGDSTVTETGGLLFGEVNYVLPTGPRVSHDQVYLNAFVGIDAFSSAARDQATGGPLGRTGLLFAAVGMGPTYGPPLGNAVDDTWGAAAGFEKFLNHGRDVFVLEIGGRHDWNREDWSAIAAGARYQHALGRRLVLRLDSFGSGVNISKGKTSAQFGWGSRCEVLFKF